MNNNTASETVAFILGAGFSVDAASEAGYPAETLPIFGWPARYPLVSDLLKVCFNIDILPHGKSIESLFQEQIDKGDSGPLDILYKYIMALDYHITCYRLKYDDNNVYMRFLRHFPKSPLITFNYDSLPEILLLSDGSWSPIDGYGVPVQVEQKTIGSPPLKESRRPILHLHGSLCVNYPATLESLGRGPEFFFDPDNLGHCFSHFARAFRSPYIYVVDRAIAPVPDKAKGLKGAFIRAVYNKAMELLNAANQIIVIGYSFNQYDHTSYAKLLTAVPGKPVLLVAPCADALIERLVIEYPNILWEAECRSFKEWVYNGYPGVRN